MASGFYPLFCVSVFVFKWKEGRMMILRLCFIAFDSDVAHQEKKEIQTFIEQRDKRLLSAAY